MEIRDTRNGEWHWVYNAVLADSHINPSDKLVYGAISTFGGHQVIHPTITQIAARCDLSERAVQMSIAKLEEVEYISQEKSVGRGNANVYYLLKSPKGCKFCTISKRCNPRQEKVQTTAIKGATVAPHIDIYKDNKDIVVGKPTTVQEVPSSDDSEESTRSVSDRRVKDKQAVYKVFSARSEGWMIYQQERAAALRLFDRGIDKVFRGRQIMRENEDDPYCPQADTPMEYEKKLPALRRFIKRKGISL